MYVCMVDKATHVDLAYTVTIAVVKHRKLDFGLNLFFSYIYIYFQLILVAKGTHFKNLPGAGLAPLSNLRY